MPTPPFGEDTGPSLRECLQLSAKAFAGIAALLGLSFLAEQAVLFFGGQLPKLPLLAALVFCLLLLGALIVNHIHYHEISTNLWPVFRRWFTAHRRNLLQALLADCLILLGGVLPGLVVFTLLPPRWAVPHLLCLAIMGNLLLICPERRPGDEEHLDDDF